METQRRLPLLLARYCFVSETEELQIKLEDVPSFWAELFSASAAGPGEETRLRRHAKQCLTRLAVDSADTGVVRAGVLLAMTHLSSETDLSLSLPDWLSLEKAAVRQRRQTQLVPFRSTAAALVGPEPKNNESSSSLLSERLWDRELYERLSREDLVEMVLRRDRMIREGREELSHIRRRERILAAKPSALPLADDVADDELAFSITRTGRKRGQLPPKVHQ
jgi:hypothetical protein